MQAYTLYSFSIWYKEHIIDTKCVDEFKKTLLIISNSKNALHGNKVKAKEVIINSFKSLNYKIDLTKLTQNDKKIISHLEIEGFIYDSPCNFILTILELYSVTEAITFLKEYEKKLLNATTATIHILNSLPKLLSEKDLTPPQITQGKQLTRLTFHNKASINDIVNLKDWSKSWYTIARGFSMANHQSPEEFEIVKVDNGSLIIDLQLTLETVKLIAETMSSIAELTTDLTAMYAALESIKALKKIMSNKTYSAAETEAKNKVEEEKSNIILKVVAHLKNKKLFTRDDATNELTSSIKELIKFNEEGGSLECITNNQLDTDTIENKKMINKLNQSFITYQNKSDIKLIIEKPLAELEK